MKRALPGWPILIGLVGLSLLGLGAWFLAASKTNAIELSPIAEAALGQSRTDAQSIEPARFAPSQQLAAGIQTASPFAADHSPYSRVPVRAAPTEPDLKPELIGVLGTGETRAALIIWRLGEQASRYGLGDTTPLGQLIGIESSAVTIRSDAGEETRLTLFAQQ